jgi:hypothetical protein
MLLDAEHEPFEELLPAQPASMHNQTINLSFPAPSPVLVNLLVDASPGCGGIAWPAGQVWGSRNRQLITLTSAVMQVLAAYLAKRGTEYLEGKNILELGSGTGLVGLVAGILGGRVWITDQAFVVSIEALFLLLTYFFV